MFVFQFDDQKSGDMILSNNYRDELEQKFNDLKFSLFGMIGFLESQVRFYRSTMESAVNGHKTYFSHTNLMELHQKLKNEILAKIQLQTNDGEFNIIVRICMRIYLKLENKKTVRLHFNTDSRRFGLQQIGIGLSTICE